MFPAEDGTPILLTINKNPNFESEVLDAYEIGYRLTPQSNLTFDIATFFNHYDEIEGLESGTPFPSNDPAPPHLVLPQTLVNNAGGNVYGGEAAATWQVLDWWRIQMWYSFLKMQITDTSTNGQSPENQALIRSSMTLAEDFEFDPVLRYVDSLPSQDIDSYFELSLHIGYRPAPGVVLSLTGQNLLEERHQEFTNTFVGGIPAELQRAVLAKIEWRF